MRGLHFGRVQAEKWSEFGEREEGVMGFQGRPGAEALGPAILALFGVQGGGASCESPVMLGESTICRLDCRQGAMTGERAAEILCPGEV